MDTSDIPYWHLYSQLSHTPGVFYTKLFCHITWWVFFYLLLIYTSHSDVTTFHTLIIQYIECWTVITGPFYDHLNEMSEWVWPERRPSLWFPHRNQRMTLILFLYCFIARLADTKKDQNPPLHCNVSLLFFCLFVELETLVCRQTRSHNAHADIHTHARINQSDLLVECATAAFNQPRREGRRCRHIPLFPSRRRACCRHTEHTTHAGLSSPQWNRFVPIPHSAAPSCQFLR